jgi:hypothetical protein
LPKNPRDVGDVWNLDRSEILRVKGASFVICPRESFLVSRDDPFDKLDLFR